MLAEAGTAATAALDAQLATTGAARLWLPARRSRAAAFGPGADLREPLDLPVLIIAGSDLGAQTQRLAADLADAVIEVPATTCDAAGDAAGGPATALAPHSVALLNRGTPSGLVTPAGQLTMALMRACSTWPCGVWIDGKKRTTPDGTSFAWQHWSHTFEYALAAGAGTWRTAGFAEAGQDYNHDLLTVVADLHAGPLPASTRLASVEPAGVLLSTLKPHGNPLAPAAQPDPADGVTVRLRDLRAAAPVTARVGLFTGLASASTTGLCEDGAGTPLAVAGGEAQVTVPAAGLTTLVTVPGSMVTGDTVAGGTVAGGTVAGGVPRLPADSFEPARPVYARYWLHGKGPAPAGNMPVAVHLSPASVALDGGQPGTLRLTVACGPAPAAGQIRFGVPAGFTVTPSGPLDYDLPSLGHYAVDLTVTAPPGAGPGRWFVTAEIDEPSGQVIEDTALLAIGQPPPPRLDLPLPEVVAMQQAAETALAGRGRRQPGQSDAGYQAGRD